MYIIDAWHLQKKTSERKCFAHLILTINICEITSQNKIIKLKVMAAYIFMSIRTDSYES